ncbi:MAG: DUF4339 domain-containing protein [Muribaculaceae bacterium]|nr:DUF4339 domain-containing protein [Muribaculaceae bacterium]
MRYYIAENGQPAGPFEPKELLAHGLTVNSLVWGEGMPNWTSASQVPELMALLTGNPVDVTGTGGIDMQMPQMPPVGGQMPLPPIPQMPMPQQPTTPTTPYNPGPTTNQPVNFPQGGPTAPQQRQVMPKTWLMESIIATVVSCLCCGANIFGLIPGGIAIFNAWGSKTCYTKGDNAGGDKKAASAKMWFYITLAIGLAATLYGGYQLISNPQLIQDIQNGNYGALYGIQ